MSEDKTPRQRELWLKALRDDALEAAYGSQIDLNEAANTTGLVCRVPVCGYPDSCFVEDCPFDTGNLKDVCPRSVIRG